MTWMALAIGYEQVLLMAPALAHLPDSWILLASRSGYLCEVAPMLYSSRSAVAFMRLSVGAAGPAPG